MRGLKSFRIVKLEIVRPDSGYFNLLYTVPRWDKGKKGFTHLPTYPFRCFTLLQGRYLWTLYFKDIIKW